MKTKRIINASVWMLIAACLTIGVCLQWSAQEAPVKSLILGSMFYISFAFLFGWMVDEHIRRANK